MRKLSIFVLALVSVFVFFASKVLAVETTLTTIRVNPADFRNLAVGDVINASALAINQYDLPVHGGVTYEWGVSSNNSVVHISPDQDGKVATIKVVGEGQGDIFVTAHLGSQQVTRSFLLTVGVNSSACAADIDQSGTVNLADYSLLAANFMKSPPSTLRADINQSGKVDLADYTLLVASFFQSCP